MDDEKLIEIIRGYPALYDPSHYKYMDISYKSNVWNKIGKEMKENVAMCKARWNNIRDNFRKSLKRTATQNEQSSKRVILYKYSEQLGFIKKYFKEKDTIGNIKCQKEEEDNEKQEYVEENIIDGLKEVYDDDEFFPGQLSPVPTHEDGSEASGKLATKKSTKNDVAYQPSESSKLLEYGISTLHPVDAFLSGISVTLKSLPPYYLNLAKSEIFATVQKYELKMLMDQHEDPSSDHMTPWHYPNSSTLVSTPKMSPVDHQYE